jgi:hypothetical protein
MISPLPILFAEKIQWLSPTGKQANHIIFDSARRGICSSPDQFLLFRHGAMVYLRCNNPAERAR